MAGGAERRRKDAGEACHMATLPRGGGGDGREGGALCGGKRGMVASVPIGRACAERDAVCGEEALQTVDGRVVVAL